MIANAARSSLFLSLHVVLRPSLIGLSSFLVLFRPRLGPGWGAIKHVLGLVFSFFFLSLFQAKCMFGHAMSSKWISVESESITNDKLHWSPET